MTRPGDVPQTVLRAKDYGWTWLTVVCLSCRHRNQLKFHDLIQERGPATRLGTIAAKLYCSKCRGRQMEYSLGTYITSGAQLWQDHRRIDFNGEVAVCAPRD